MRLAAPSPDDGDSAAPPAPSQRSGHRRHGARIHDAGPVGWRSDLPALLLSIAVIGSVLAIGTVHLPTLLIVAALTLTAAALTLARSAGSRQPIPLPAWICAALAAYTLLQVLPVPLSWIRAVSPAAGDVWDRCLLPLRMAGPRLASLSLDPGASVVEALKWTVYGAVFLVSGAIAARRGAAWGVAVVFVSAVIAALTTLIHGLAGATKVYGLYKPSFNPAAWHVGPLLNANNLAGYLNLGALVGLGLLLTHKPILPRGLVIPGVAVIVGIEVTSASRAGVLALPLGVLAFAFLAVRRPTASPGGKMASTALVVGAVIFGFALAWLGGTAGMWNELYDKDLSKLEMISFTRPLITDHPIFGIGRGAFESVFAAYRQTPGNIVFTHAENFPAQWVSEWGLPVGGVALAAFGFVLGPRRLGVQRSALASGAWLGVMILLAQNLFDLGLEVPAVSIALATVLGSLWGARRFQSRDEAHHPRFSEGKARLAPILVALTGLPLGALTFRSSFHDVSADRLVVREMFEGAKPLGKEQAAPIRAFLRASMLRHPAEPYFPLMGALVAFRVGDESALPWIQRTLERASTNGRAHLLLAEVLVARGAKKQALHEVRGSLRDDPSLIAPASVLVVRLTRSFEEIVLAAPEGKEGAMLLSAIANLLGSPADAEARSRCDQEAIARDPGVIAPRIREADRRIAALSPGSTSTLCADRARCRTEIFGYAATIEATEPELSNAAQIRARLALAEGKPEEAVRLLVDTCDRLTDREVCLGARVRAAAQVKAPEPLDAAAKDLLGAVCISGAACADTATWISKLRADRKEPGAALALLSRAAREDPSKPERWLDLAKIASGAGAHAEAADALERAAKLKGGADPELRRRIDEERAKVLGGILTP